MLLTVLALQAGVQGLVVCISSHGHVDIEAANEEGRCDTYQGCADEAACIVEEHHHDCCDTCIDVPLPHCDEASLTVAKSLDVQAPTPLAAAAAGALIHPAVACSLPIIRIANAPPPHPAFSIVALRI